MARIRTIKPEFYRHETLQDLEIANPGKYPMMVFSGLWVAADREGRFEWRPRQLKLDILPFLDFDISEVMNILADAGFLMRYQAGGVTYGAISSWERHQVISRDEPPSEIPAPDGSMTPYFRPLNQTQRFKVYERDHWTCVYCARNMVNDKRAACLDHIIPYSRGGTNRAGNLATACKRCNSAKADKTPTEAGFKWPAGLGEYLDNDTNEIRQWGVNTHLTDISTPPDKEGEGEGEGEREEEGNGEAPVSPAIPPKPKRATQLPDDFTPNETGVQYAQTRQVALTPELEAFRNWHVAKGTTMKDWQAAWRTWCDKAVEFGRAGQAPNARASPRQTAAQEREQVSKILTGRGGDAGRNERDITGETERIA